MKTASLTCVVCGESGDGLHFGASACRACAAFFRRTVAQNRVYGCREKSACHIHSTVRCMCKACRYQKCLTMGMRRSAVQKNRDSVGFRKSLSNSPSTSSDVKSPESASSVEPSNMNVLTRMNDAYNVLKGARHKIYGQGTSDPKVRASGPVLFEEACEIQSKDVALMYDFLVGCFSEFETLETHQKAILFRNFFVAFHVLEGAYTCISKGQPDLFYLASGIHYLDYLNPMNAVTHEDQIKKNENGDKLFRTAFEFFRKTLVATMLKHDVDLIEFLALVGFLIWDVGLEQQSEATCDTAKRIRETIIREVMHYYEIVRNVDEPTIRLGNLTFLPYSTQRATRRFQDNIEIGRIFDLSTIRQDSMYDLLLRES